MKKSKTKSGKKSAKKESKKAVRKELQASLSAKFKEVIEGLGHEADSIARDIEKAGKKVAKKLSGKKAKTSDKNASIIQSLDSMIADIKARRNERQEPVAAEAETVKPARRKRTATGNKTERTTVKAAARATTVPVANSRRGRKATAKTPEENDETIAAAKPVRRRKTVNKADTGSTEKPELPPATETGPES